MPLRNIERIEIVEVSFDLAIVFDGITQRDEDILDTLPHQRDRVQMSRAWPATGQRYVDAFSFSTGQKDEGPQPEAFLINSQRYVLLKLLKGKGEIRTYCWFNTSNPLLLRRK